MLDAYIVLFSPYLGNMQDGPEKKAIATTQESVPLDVESGKDASAPKIQPVGFLFIIADILHNASINYELTFRFPHPLKTFVLS